jgi:photosystem II stability/assembly factor-like uncharacterized protein
MKSGYAQWTQTNGPYGQGSYLRVHAFTKSLDESKLFIGTNNGLFVTTNNGDNWSLIIDGLPILRGVDWGGCTSLITCGNGDILVGIYNGGVSNSVEGIFRSTDDGSSWTYVGGPSAVYDFAINSSQHIFAGTEHGVFKSTDNGQTWLTVGFGQTAVSTLTIFDSIIFVGTYDHGVFKSTDNGGTWIQTALANIEVSAMVEINSTILAGTRNGVFRSTDFGSTWSQTSLDSVYVGAFAVVDSNIIAGVRNYSSGIYLSTDDGYSWSQLGATNFPVSAFEVSGSNIFAGSDGYGVWVSTDNGVSWIEKKNSGLMYRQILALKSYSPAPGDIQLFVGTQGGIYHSTDQGNDWMLMGSDSLYATAFAVEGSTIFAAHNGTMGIVRSTDNGTTWTMVNNGLCDLEITALTISSNGFVFAGSLSGNIFRSTDNGNNWVSVTDTSIIKSEITSLAFYDSTLYIATASFASVTDRGGGKVNARQLSQLGGVYISKNLGESWSPVGLSGKNIYSFSFIGDLVLAGGIGTIKVGEFISYGSGGVYISTIGDTNWVTMNTGLEDLYNNNYYVYDLVNKDSILFARTIDGRVFNFDHGQSKWISIENGLPVRSPWEKLVVDSDYLYATTQNHGIWKRHLSDFPATDLSPPQISLYALASPVVNSVRLVIGSNELLSAVEMTVNSEPLTMQHQGDLFFGTYTISSAGNLAVQASGTDLASNITFLNRTYTVSPLTKNVSFSNYTLSGDGDGYLILSKADPTQVPPTWKQIGSALDLSVTGDHSGLIAGINYRDLFLANSDFDESKIGIYEYQTDHWEYIGGHGKNGKVSATIHGGKIAVFYNPDQTSVPREFSLSQNYPNPFNPTTTLRYNVAAQGKVTMKVYNILGQEVRTLVNAVKEPGYYEVMWDGRSDRGAEVSSGMYFYRMEAGKFILTKKMLFIK